MIVAMQDSATEEEIQSVVERMMEIGFNVHRTTGAVQTILAGVGTPGVFDHKEFEVFAGVAEVIRISSPYKLAGRSFRPEGTIVRFSNGVSVGGDEVVVGEGAGGADAGEDGLHGARGAVDVEADFDHAFDDGLDLFFRRAVLHGNNHFSFPVSFGSVSLGAAEREASSLRWRARMTSTMRS